MADGWLMRQISEPIATTIAGSTGHYSINDDSIATKYPIYFLSDIKICFTFDAWKVTSKIAPEVNRFYGSLEAQPSFHTLRFSAWAPRPDSREIVGNYNAVNTIDTKLILNLMFIKQFYCLNLLIEISLIMQRVFHLC